MTTQVEYTASGVCNVFPFPFAIQTEADVEVLVGGILQNGDYSVRGQGSIDGGAVVFDNPPVSGAAVILRRRAELQVSPTDAQPGYLADKIVAGNNVTVDTVAVNGIQQVRVAADDIVAADVLRTLKAGNNIALSQISENGSDYVRIDAKGVSEQVEAGSNVTFAAGTDGRIRINAKGVSEQLVAGANVTLVTDANGQTTISAVQSDMSKVLYRDVAAVVEAGFWTKPMALAVTGGVATPDPLAGTVFTLDMVSDVTLGFPAGMLGKAGMFLVVVAQDAVGGRLLTLAEGYVVASGKWSAEANAVNLLWITSDGSGNVLDVVVARRGA